MLLCNTKCNPQDSCQDSTNPPKLDTEKDQVRWLFIHKFTQHFCLAFFQIVFFFFFFLFFFLFFRFPISTSVCPKSHTFVYVLNFFFAFIGHMDNESQMEASCCLLFPEYVSFSSGTVAYS